jgi:hypothetical protein
MRLSSVSMSTKMNTDLITWAVAMVTKHIHHSAARTCIAGLRKYCLQNIPVDRVFELRQHKQRLNDAIYVTRRPLINHACIICSKQVNILYFSPVLT